MDNPSKPSSNSSPPKPSLLEYTLRATRYRLRLANLGAALLLMLAMGLAGSLVIIVADHNVTGGLSLWTRWTLRWILAGAEACLLIALIALPLLRRISNLYAARQMEKADPSFHNDLTAAVQLQGQTSPAAATAAAVRRSASRQVSRMSNGAPVQKRGLKLAGLAAGAAMSAFCLYWLFAPKSTATSFQRAMGLGDPPAPTRTQILSFTPPDETTVLTGDEVRFEARLRYPKGPAVLKISRDAHTILDEDVLTMTPIDEPGPGEAYRVPWKAVAADGWVKFRLTCGDAETLWRRLRVLPTPALRRVKVKCDWPKYTALPPQTTEGGRVEGPVGTQATVTAEANLPVRRASLVFESDGRTLVMTPDTTGRFLSTRFRVSKPGKYVIHYELRDIDAEAKSIPHEVVVTPDRPPMVRLDQPAGAMTLAQNESLGVLGEVADDFGVGQVELVCKDRNDRTKTHPLMRQNAPGASSRQVRSNIKAGALGRPGDTLTCVVQARDRNPSAPGGGQVTQSKPFKLTITPPQTTAEKQEAAGGEGLAENGQPQNGQTEQKQPQGNQIELAQAQTESKETQPPFGKSEGEKTKPDPKKTEKLEKLCAAMQREEKTKEPKASSNELNENGDPSRGKNGKGQKSSSNTKEENNKPKSGEKGNASQGSKAGEKGNAPQQGKDGQGQGQQQNSQPQGGASQNPMGAQTVHDRKGSGAGTETREGELAAVDDKALMPGTTQPLESVGRALDKARRQIEGDAVDPKLLEAMDMTLPEFKSFVEKYTKEYTKALQKRKNQKHTVRISQPVGRANVQRGVETKTGNVTADSSLEKKRAKKDRGLSPTKVSPEYRKQLEAYLRAVSEGEEK